MALDPNIDPAIAAQIYGDIGPSLADAAPPGPAAPWSWVPDHWHAPDGEIAPGIVPPSSAAPFATPALAPPDAAPPGPPPPLDADLAGNPALPPPDVAAPPSAPIPVFGPQLADAPPLPWAPQTPQAPALPNGPPLMPYGAVAGAPDAAGRGPLPPGVAGPAPATVRDLPGVSITEEPPAIYADQVAQRYVGHVLDIPDDEMRSRALESLASHDPDEAIRQSEAWQARNERDLEAKKYEASVRNFDQQKANWEARVRADQATQRKMDEVAADVQRIAATKPDPSGGVHGLRAVGGVLQSIVGGLVQSRTGSARNAGLDALDATINSGIEAQKAQLATQMQGAVFRRNALAEEFERHGDLQRAAEVVRMAAYDQAIKGLEDEAQKYAWGGTTSMRILLSVGAAKQRRAQAFESLRKTTLDEHLKQEEQARKTAETASTIAKNAAEVLKYQAEAAKLGRGAGAGAGSATNPKYTVPTGWFNPFDGTQPIYGKRQIGGKGEDPKERNAVGAQIGTYAHVQDYWAKLRALGDQIGYAKSLGESAWKARRGTLESNYDAAKEALTVYLTKELGDKLTQGQLEAQAHRIPDRASVFEARDPGQQIAAAQQDADRDFGRDMNQVGIDPDPIIRAAQQRRERVQPTAEAEADAAHAALASDPEDKNAQREATEADQRLQAEVAKDQQRKIAIDTVRALPSYIDPLPFDEDRPAAEVATAKGANRDAEHYGALYSQFIKAAGDTSHRKGLKPGELAAAERANDRKLGDMALEVLAARKQATEQRNKASGIAQHNAFYERLARETGRPLEELLEHASPLDQVLYDARHRAPPPPAAPRFPDHSYAPGAGPDEPGYSTNPFAPKPATEHHHHPRSGPIPTLPP